jgi:hypothetical protein
MNVISIEFSYEQWFMIKALVDEKLKTDPNYIVYHVGEPGYCAVTPSLKYIAHVLDKELSEQETISNEGE